MKGGVVSLRVIFGVLLLCSISACSPFRESVYVAPEVYSGVVSVENLQPMEGIEIQHYAHSKGIARSDEQGQLRLAAVKDYNSEVLKLSFFKQAQLIKVKDPQTEQSFLVVAFSHRLSETLESVEVPTLFVDSEPDPLAPIPHLMGADSTGMSQQGLNLEETILSSLVADSCDQGILDSARLALNTARKVYWKAQSGEMGESEFVDQAYQHVVNLWAYLHQTCQLPVATTSSHLSEQESSAHVAIDLNGVFVRVQNEARGLANVSIQRFYL